MSIDFAFDHHLETDPNYEPITLTNFEVNLKNKPDPFKITEILKFAPLLEKEQKREELPDFIANLRKEFFTLEEELEELGVESAENISPYLLGMIFVSVELDKIDRSAIFNYFKILIQEQSELIGNTDYLTLVEYLSSENFLLVYQNLLEHLDNHVLRLDEFKISHIFQSIISETSDYPFLDLIGRVTHFTQGVIDLAKAYIHDSTPNLETQELALEVVYNKLNEILFVATAITIAMTRFINHASQDFYSEEEFLRFSNLEFDLGKYFPDPTASVLASIFVAIKAFEKNLPYPTECPDFTLEYLCELD
ncbi:hypothetical protein [Psittacicella gerlachiana]|uniref:Uncharacterized protein n=1 Tax=Psittacicella gerlachiana TaxID=2028574 RepID=A0A3A1YE74_9GAMM|nr:hypothetical protein [Psittacicella gerlachiana]RIY35460.1 hypothetical protein CKF59_03620 [Psittacicella gerlachiana]